MTATMTPLSFSSNTAPARSPVASGLAPPRVGDKGAESPFSQMLSSQTRRDDAATKSDAHEQGRNDAQSEASTESNGPRAAHPAAAHRPRARTDRGNDGKAGKPAEAPKEAGASEAAADADSARNASAPRRLKAGEGDTAAAAAPLSLPLPLPPASETRPADGTPAAADDDVASTLVAGLPDKAGGEPVGADASAAKGSAADDAAGQGLALASEPAETPAGDSKECVAAAIETLNIADRKGELQMPAAPVASDTPFARLLDQAKGDATVSTQHIAVPFTSADFAPALGSRLAVMAQDGVQQAQLQINPPELGPITVQIALDGAQVTVDFAADVAATRERLEASLPELAGALRESGLTLAGGGVHEHARGQGQGGGSQNDAGRGHDPGQGPAPNGERSAVLGTGSGTGTAREALAGRARGVVDLFA